jgi:polar amino acid transport system substrate-binding protein
MPSTHALFHIPPTPEASLTRRTLLTSLALWATGCAQPGGAPETIQPPSWAQRSTLRVAINHGNAVLARRDPRSGELSGVSVDIARELARQLNRPVELIPFDAANKSVEGVRGGQADVGFFAIDPLRSEGLAFTAPYVIIEGAYVVPQSSPIQSSSDVDRSGVRIAVATRSAYDLYLSRNIRQATLVKTTRSDQVVDLMLSQQLDVAAGVKQQLERDMQRVPGLRMLQPSFMQIQQAMATSATHPQDVRYLHRFVEQLKASGFVHQSLARHRIEGVTIAPAQSH